MLDKNPVLRVIYNIGLVVLPLFIIIISLMIGSYSIDPSSVFEMIFKGFTGSESEESAVTQNLFWTIRFPRVLCAALAGAGLSLAGAVFQSIFKNPLASPYTLGVSNGAGFGAAFGIVLSLGTIGIQFSSVLFGLISIGITFLLAAKSRSSTASLILAGMLVSALFSSLISVLKLLADPFEKLPQIVFWLMGSLSSSTMAKFLYILPMCSLCILIIILYRWKINVMSMGDQEARSFGVNISRDRAIVVVMASILTAMIVSISGIIGWVGIVVPHLARLTVGPDFRKILPACVSYGICYLVIIDDVCRVISTSEIPIGVVTGIIGAPLFIFFIIKKRVEW